MTEKRRPVNRLLGAKPSFGPIPGEMILPWGSIAFVIFIICYWGLGLPWFTTGILIAWGCGVWWILTGNRPYRFLSKFMRVPSKWSRGYVRHQPVHKSDIGMAKRKRK
jgi:hypothetical protein